MCQFQKRQHSSDDLGAERQRSRQGVARAASTAERTTSDADDRPETNTRPSHQPLRPDEIVSNNTLRILAKGEPEWQRGEISPEIQAMLAMILPDMCGELIALRAATAESAITPPALGPRAHETSIAE